MKEHSKAISGWYNKQTILLLRGKKKKKKKNLTLWDLISRPSDPQTGTVPIELIRQTQQFTLNISYINVIDICGVY